MLDRTWKPQRTRYGVSLWTFNLSLGKSKVATFVAIRRDRDGAIMSPRSWMTRRVIPGSMQHVYDAFDTYLNMICALFIDGLDVPCKCVQCNASASVYVDPLIAAISALLEGKKP